MPVSETRYRAYRAYRRRHPDRTSSFAAWVTSKPRYGVDGYSESQSVVVDCETFHVRIVPDEDGWMLFREDVENGIFTDDDADDVYYRCITVTHPASGLSASLCGVSEDVREYYAERYTQETVCDLIEEVRAGLPDVAPALLPFTGFSPVG